jgi:site-specific recombinase XerD
VRDYRAHLQAVLKRKPATVNSALAAFDDFYIRRGLGAASAKRAEIPDAGPRALDHKAQLQYLRAVQARSSPRDRALELVPFYAGARIAETVALDVDDVRLSARQGILPIYGKGSESGRSQSTPSCARPLPTGSRSAATGRERRRPGAVSQPARPPAERQGAHDVITGIADRGGPEDHVTAHVLQALVRDHARARRHRPGDRRRAARPRTTRDHTGLHAPDRRGPQQSHPDLLPVDE